MYVGAAISIRKIKFILFVIKGLCSGYGNLVLLGTYLVLTKKFDRQYFLVPDLFSSQRYYQILTIRIKISEISPTTTTGTRLLNQAQTEELD